MFTSFPRPLASLEVERARSNQRMLAGIVGTGCQTNRTRRKSSSSFGKLTSSLWVKTERFKQRRPQFVPDVSRMLLPQEPVEDRSSQPTDAKETVLVCIAFAISC